MAPGMTIEANTDSGKIVIEAVDRLTRRYSWGSSSKVFTLWPRPKRWMGSKSAYKALGGVVIRTLFSKKDSNTSIPNRKLSLG